MPRGVGSHVQSVQAQVRIVKEAAVATELQGLSRILVMLLKSNPDITPFHIQTLVHKREVESLRGDPALEAHLASVLAAARERDDLSEGAQQLLQVELPPHAAALGSLSEVHQGGDEVVLLTTAPGECATCCRGSHFGQDLLPAAG